MENKISDNVEIKLPGKKENSLSENSEKESNGREMKLFFALLIALIIVVAGFIYSLHLTQAEEGYTEIYFGKNADKINVNENYFIEFTVSNKENKEIEYTYKISYAENEISKSIKVKEDESKSFSEKLVFTEPGNKKVIVDLYKNDYKSENNEPNPMSIWFWVEVEEII